MDAIPFRTARWLAVAALVSLVITLVGGPAAAQALPDDPTAKKPWAYLPAVYKPGPGLVPLTPQCVDCPKNFSTGTQYSLRLDSLGHPHISYGSDHLYHAWFDGAAWQYETVDSSPGVGVYSALAFDKAGKPAIAYLDFYNHTLKLARWSGSAWTFQAVDTATTIYTYPTLLFDSAGNPMLAYVADYGEDSYQVKFTRWNGSAWAAYPAVDTDINAYQRAAVSLALDKGGAPHLCYFRNDTARSGGLMYASWSGAAWTLQIVEEDNYKGNDCSLAFDSLGVPHISYYDDWDGIKYASWNGTTSQWDLEFAFYGPTEERTSATSLSFGPGDQPMIAVALGQSTPTRLVWLAYKVPGGFVHSQVGEGMWPSLALDSGGKPHVSYIDFFHGQTLHYASLTAWNANPDKNTWVNEALDSGAQIGQGISMAMDSFGRPHLAYMDLGNNLLKYAYQSNGAWMVKTVDVPGISPAHGHSLAVDAQGRPHIAYVDYAAKKVMYATLNDSTWTAEVAGDDAVGAADDILKFISLALDASGNPHISFYNEHDVDLKHYYKDASGWHAEEVDKATGITGLYNAIAIDSAGKIHISYQYQYAEKLMYAYKDGSGWHKTLLDSTYGAGMNTAIAIDSANHPHICYSDFIDYYLKYTHYDGSQWVTETLTPSSKNPNDSRQPICSIKIGPGNVPYISYYDRISRHLTLKHKSGTTWVTETLDTSGDTGEHNSLALFNGVPYVAYYHTSNKDLMFIMWKQ